MTPCRVQDVVGIAVGLPTAFGSPRKEAVL
jgi:hypothetical protein